MKAGEAIALTDRYQMKNYSRAPVTFVRGEGSWLYDDREKRYLDFLGGIAVAVLGHAHPGVTRAISEQAGKLVHVSNLFHVPSQALLGERLSKAAYGGSVFFCNSGTEANEAAIKLVRKWSHGRKPEGPHAIVVLSGSFHGRTYGGLSATGQPKFHEGFEPMLPGFVTVPFGDIEALGRALEAGACAFLVEPIQGESGVRMHPEGYLKEAEALCRKTGTLLVADEIQSGMGRTGTFLAFERHGIAPDVVTMAKGLANGLPLGALVAREDVAAAFGPGSHGSTFGGNPVACAASLAVLEEILAPGFLAAVVRKGERLSEGLRRIAARRADVVEVRGAGLMIGMEIEGEAKPIVARCLEQGLVINAAGNSVLRFLPALNVSEDEIDRALSILSGVMA
ncbi:MAG: aspartate aminotransferase family protein [Deltaproteobacteria bacterium]|nr:aspartate aminotransferase family protein [Deltaproteobacteria bacterium]